MALAPPGLLGSAGLGPGCGSDAAQVSSPHSGTEAAGAACGGSVLLVDIRKVAGRRAPRLHFRCQPHHPLDKAEQITRVGRGAPPAEEGQGGWE